MKSPSIPNSSYKATSLFSQALSNVFIHSFYDIEFTLRGFQAVNGKSFFFYQPSPLIALYLQDEDEKTCNEATSWEQQYSVTKLQFRRFNFQLYKPILSTLHSTYITVTVCCRYLSDDVIERRNSVNVASCLNSFNRKCNACF